ncbi:MAG: hypothetical protein OSA89_15760 [Mariniblastus sp.]|nr:hypothetical protein [Mariniblastus sp.]
MKLVIILVSAAAASIVVTLILKSLGIEGSSIIGGGVGGAVGSFVGVKILTNKKIESD